MTERRLQGKRDNIIKYPTYDGALKHLKSFTLLLSQTRVNSSFSGMVQKVAERKVNLRRIESRR